MHCHWWILLFPFAPVDVRSECWRGKRKLSEKSNCHLLRLVGFCNSVEEGGGWCHSAFLLAWEIGATPVHQVELACQGSLPALHSRYEQVPENFCFAQHRHSTPIRHSFIQHCTVTFHTAFLQFARTPKFLLVSAKFAGTTVRHSAFLASPTPLFLVGTTIWRLLVYLLITGYIGIWLKLWLNICWCIFHLTPLVSIESWCKCYLVYTLSISRAHKNGRLEQEHVTPIEAHSQGKIIEPFSFHNNLKTHYLDGKVNRRVDFLVCALLEIESDYFFKYNQKQMLGGLNPKAVREEHRHQRGMLILALSIEVRSLLCTLLLML